MNPKMLGALLALGLAGCGGGGESLGPPAFVVSGIHGEACAMVEAGLALVLPQDDWSFAGDGPCTMKGPLEDLVVLSAPDPTEKPLEERAERLAKRRWYVVPPDSPHWLTDWPGAVYFAAVAPPSARGRPFSLEIHWESPAGPVHIVYTGKLKSTESGEALHKNLQGFFARQILGRIQWFEAMPPLPQQGNPQITALLSAWVQALNEADEKGYLDCYHPESPVQDLERRFIKTKAPLFRSQGGQWQSEARDVVVDYDRARATVLLHRINPSGRQVQQTLDLALELRKDPLRGWKLFKVEPR